jgi:hypothetical protein
MVQRSRLVLRAARASLLLISPIFLVPTSSAQISPSTFENPMRAAAKAQNEGRLLDAEKILRDAIAETHEVALEVLAVVGSRLRRLVVIIKVPHCGSLNLTGGA